MELENEIRQDIIQSLEAGSEESQRESECSLNPNAAEFVPSYLKSSEADEKAQCQEPEPDPCHNKAQADSTTTLVEEQKETVGDAEHSTTKDPRSHIERQLYNLMNQLGNEIFPLSEMHFILSTNGQGINVLFKVRESPTMQQLDEKLCLAAGLRVEIGDSTLQHTQPGNALAAQFLSRMSAILDNKNQATEGLISPKCSLSKKNSYTELEIERQIQDIKAIEEIINEDGETLYQDAFKELCQKLGLATSCEQVLNAEAKAAMSSNETINDFHADVKILPYLDDNEQPYIWDSLPTELSTLKDFKYLNYSTPKIQINEPSEPQQDVTPLSTPTMTTTTTTTTTNGSSTYPKLCKLDHLTVPCPLKINNSKEKECKKQRMRFGLEAPVTGTAKAKGTGATPKKTQVSPLFMNGKCSKSQYRDTLPKPSVFKQIPELVGIHSDKPFGICKLVKRSQAKGLSSPQPEQVHVHKTIKAATLGRTGTTGQVLGTAGQIQGTTGHVKGTTGHVKGTTGHVKGTTAQLQGTPGQVLGTIGQVKGTTGKLQSTTGQVQGSTVHMKGTPGKVQGATGQMQGTTGQEKGTTGQVKGTPEQAEGTPGQVQGIPGKVQGTPGQVQGILGQVLGTIGQVKGTTGKLQGTTGQVEGVKGQVQGTIIQLKGTTGQVEATPGQLEDTTGQLQGTTGQVEGATGQVQDTTVQLQGTPGQVEGTPGQVEGATVQLQGTPGQVEGATGKVHSTTGQVQGTPGQLLGTPGQVLGSTGQVKGTPGQLQGITGQVQSNPGQVQGATGQVQGTTGQKQGTPGQVPGTTGQVKGTPGQLQGITGQVQGATGQVQGTPGQVKGSTGHVKDSTGQAQGTPGQVHGTPGQAQGTKGRTLGTKGRKQGTPGVQRIIAPRSTHASQMRLSEVKRRLNLMRGDNEYDVPFNEYLFK